MDTKQKQQDFLRLYLSFEIVIHISVLSAKVAQLLFNGPLLVILLFYAVYQRESSHEWGLCFK